MTAVFCCCCGCPLVLLPLEGREFEAYGVEEDDGAGGFPRLFFEDGRYEPIHRNCLKRICQFFL